MTANETTQIREVIARSHSILAQSLILELYRAIACCRIAKLKRCGLESLPYLMAAEATSVKFKDLQLQGKRIESESILDLMGRLEEELTGSATPHFSRSLGRARSLALFSPLPRGDAKH